MNKSLSALTKDQQLHVQVTNFRVRYASLYTKIRGQELRDHITDFEAGYVYTLLNDDDASEDVEKKCGDEGDDGWIDEVVKEPLQRQNAWKEEDITKLLD